MVSGQRGPSHHEHDLPSEAGEIQSSLACRVGSADDVDHITLALVRLACCRAVVDTTSGELGEPGRRQSPIGDAGSDDEGTAFDFARTIEEHSAYRSAALKPTTSRARTISAPKRETCAIARCARSEPLKPLGKPR